jgi:hypothetical protein
LAKIGETTKATEILEKLKALPDDSEEKAFDLFFVYAGLGKLDEMFKQLDLAFDNRSLLFRVLRYSSIVPTIKEDPRYAALFERANLRP